MAKVTGPLMSMDASGKIANAIVFSKWKGRNTVRRFVIPMNPMTEGQGDQRIAIGGTGKAAGKVQVGSSIDLQLIALNAIPSGQSKQSFLVKYILSNFLTSPATYASLLSTYISHTAHTDFESAGATLGISEFDLGYASVSPYQKGFGVYLLAKACQALGFTGEPYATALASWDASEISAFVADFAV